MGKLDIKWLKTFILAAKYGNFRRASEELFLTQPAVTKHIKRLENHISIDLFERTGKQVALTPAGYKFLPYAEEMVKTYEEGMQEFERWKQGYNRKLTIAAAPQIAASILPVFLRGFIDDHPEMEVIIHVVKSFEIGEMVSLGKADIGLTRIKPIQTDVSCKVIHKEPVILVAPFMNADAMLNEEQLLHQYRILTNNHPAYWGSLLTNIKKYYPRIQTIPVSQMEITKRFIEQGLGVSYLPVTMVQEELAAQKMVQVKQDKIESPTSFTYVLTKIETPEVKQCKTSLAAYMKIK